MAKKLATLEMKEINERQRAEHAMRMYEQRREMINELEARNSELEQKFAEVTRMNLESQRVERQLRDELSSTLCHRFIQPICYYYQVIIYYYSLRSLYYHIFIILQ